MVSALLTMCGQTIMLLEKVTCNIFSISDRTLNTIYFFFFIYLLLISFRIFAIFKHFFSFGSYFNISEDWILFG